MLKSFLACVLASAVYFAVTCFARWGWPDFASWDVADRLFWCLILFWCCGMAIVVTQLLLPNKEYLDD